MKGAAEETANACDVGDRDLGVGDGDAENRGGKTSTITTKR